MTILAPSWAAFRAIALPMPREAPVMKTVRPANFLWKQIVTVTCDFLSPLRGMKVHISGPYRTANIYAKKAFRVTDPEASNPISPLRESRSVGYVPGVDHCWGNLNYSVLS